MSELPDLGIIQQKRIKMDDTELKMECVRQANYRLVADEKNTTADLIKVADDIYKFVTSSSGFPKAAEG